MVHGSHRYPLIYWCVSLSEQDQQLLQIVDAASAEAKIIAGDHLTCHPGCTPCCFGPFAITRLDAWRLQRGLQQLVATAPETVTGIRSRAATAKQIQADAFPSHRTETFLDETEERQHYDLFPDAPCPALEPESGACLVYSWRPVACRTYGPPVRIAGDNLPACPLCFTHATTSEIDSARQQIDLEAVEQPLIDNLQRETGRVGRTTVAFAITEAHLHDGHTSPGTRRA